MQEIQDRQDWLNKNVPANSYKAWYGGFKSDDRYIQFLNEEDALAYKIMWMMQV